MNNIKIQIPEGYQIDIANSNLEKGDIKFKKVENILPTKWDDLEEIKGYYVTSQCYISEVSGKGDSMGRNIWPTRELAEASIALCQLVRLRDIYNGGWVPDFTDKEVKHVIAMHRNSMILTACVSVRYLFAFKSQVLAREFLNNFKDLIEKAKPLL